MQLSNLRVTSDMRTLVLALPELPFGRICMMKATV